MKVVAVSASVFEDQREQIRAAGCDDFLGKPLQAAELYRTLARLCNLKLQQQPERQASATERTPALPVEVAFRIGTRLTQLAEVGDITAIESLSAELQDASEPEQSLAERIDEMLRRFDLDALRSLAKELTGSK